MKTIYLFRHSKPDKTPGQPNERIPLSRDGRIQMRVFPAKLQISRDAKIFTSPYRRALETAQMIGDHIFPDNRLIERQTGPSQSFTKELWANQYVDPELKSLDGESFRMVRERMTAAVQDILLQMQDGETVVIVSHAAAICAFLQQYCDISVTDADKKCRRIVYQNRLVHEGDIHAPSCFKLNFDKGLCEISYHD